MKKLTSLIVAALCALLLAGVVHAESSGYPLDPAPDRSKNLPALQNGAKLFVNYCLNCHSAASVRYNRLMELGLTEEQIKQNLLFTGEKVGDMMVVAAKPKDQKAWFGAQPPDLSVIARAKSSQAGSGADYIYTYMRTFYRDDTRETGWNNKVYPPA
jgi:ubiquinol-cytochrome c reductase cytochrome c1 subunit